MTSCFQELYYDPRHDDVAFIKENCQVSIGFRKTLLMLDKRNFYSFLLLVRKISKYSHVWNDPQVQSVMIATPCKELQLLVTHEELNRLQKMLETANELLSKIPEWRYSSLNATAGTMTENRKMAMK